VRARTDDAEYCMGYRSIEAIENGVLGKCDSCGVVAGRHGYQLILLRMHVPARRLARRTDESIDLRAMDSSSSFRESIEYRDVRVRVRSTSRPALNACSLLGATCRRAVRFRRNQGNRFIHGGRGGGPRAMAS
jgi:hypothetical protein